MDFTGSADKVTGYTAKSAVEQGPQQDKNNKLVQNYSEYQPSRYQAG
jgi:hypothetical protein